MELKNMDYMDIDKEHESEAIDVVMEHCKAIKVSTIAPYDWTITTYAIEPLKMWIMEKGEIVKKIEYANIEFVEGCYDIYYFENKDEALAEFNKRVKELKEY